MKRSSLFVLSLLSAFALVLLTVACAAAPAAAPEPRAVRQAEVTAVPAMPTAPAGAEAGARAPSGVPPAALAAQWDRKIIKTATIRLETADLFSALNQITLLSSQAGGYVLTSKTWYEGEYPRAAYTFAVPVERFEETLEQVRRLGKVLSEETSGQDVTDQYVDLEARIRNQEATAERIRGFLEETRTVTEALAVNQELTRVEEELERLKGQRNALAQRAAFSTITVELVTVVAAIEAKEPEVPWSPLKTLASAVKVLAAILQVLVDIAIYVVVLSLPVIVILGLIFLIIRIVRRLAARKPRAS